MARKTKRRQPARPRRPAAPAGAQPAPGTGTARTATRPGRIGGDQALVRSVEMSLAPGQGVSPRRGGRIVLDSGDPAIPLDRVPYFVTDLLRLAAVAGAMIVLLVVGALVIVPHFVH